MWTRGELKERGKIAFKANYWKCVLVGVILALISGGLSSGSSYKSGGNFAQQSEQMKENFSNASPEAITAAVIGVLAVVFIIVLVAVVIGFIVAAFLLNPVKVGCLRFFVRNLDEPAELSNLSRGFEGNYKNVVRVLFFRDLYLLLWNLIPVAGFFIGIYKYYEYYMIPYIMGDDPDMDRDEAFALSKEMMDGQKWNTFVLGLSFIGWHILSILTIGILEIFYVEPYVQSTKAALYETLSDGYTDNVVVDSNNGYIAGN